MKLHSVPPSTTAALRRRAEERLRARRPEKDGIRTEADTQRLVQELQIHQIELEMQNEELSQANARAEASALKFSDLYDFAPIGYVILDDHGRIQELNFMAAKLLGKTRAELADTLLIKVVAQPDRDIFVQHLKTASETEAKVASEVGLRLEDGRIVSVQLYTVYRRDTSGQPSHYLTAITDITVRNRMEEEIRKLNEELEERVLQRTATIRTLVTELTLAEQREKSRLAQILHDHLQQASGRI